MQSRDGHQKTRRTGETSYNESVVSRSKAGCEPMRQHNGAKGEGSKALRALAVLTALIGGLLLSLGSAGQTGPLPQNHPQGYERSSGQEPPPPPPAVGKTLQEQEDTGDATGDAPGDAQEEGRGGVRSLPPLSDAPEPRDTKPRERPTPNRRGGVYVPPPAPTPESQ